MIDKNSLVCKKSFGEILYTDSKRSIIDQLSDDNIIIGTQYKTKYFKETYNINEIEYYNICVKGDIYYTQKCNSSVCNNLVKFRGLSVGYYNHCCKKCSRREQIISTEQKEKFAHCNKGKKLSPEHIQKIIDKRIGTHHSEEAKENMRKARLNIGFIPWSEEKRESMKNFLKSGGVFGKMYANPKKYDLSKLHGKNQFKSGVFESKKSTKKCYYRSSYELKLLEILEDDINVIKITVEPFSIIYEGIDQKNHRYLPDCLVELIDHSKILIEVKPERLLNTEKNILKINAGVEYCKSHNIEFSVLTEKELWNNNGLTILKNNI